MEKIHTEVHAAYRDEHGIIHVEIREGAHINEESFIKLRAVINRLAENKKMRVLVDARPHHTMTDQAMEFLKTDMLDRERIATAIISKKLGIRLMVDYFTHVVKAKSQVKMFSAHPDAIEWLRSFPGEN